MLIRITVNNVWYSKHFVAYYYQSVVLCKPAFQLCSGCAMQTNVLITHQDVSLNSSQHCMPLWYVHLAVSRTRLICLSCQIQYADCGTIKVSSGLI